MAMRAVGERDRQVTRMVGVSAAAHAVVLVLALVVLPAIRPMPLPIVAYTVELTDPSALGGRLPPGPVDKPLGARPGPEANAGATTKLGVPDAPPTPAVPPGEKAVAPPPLPVEKVEAPKPPAPSVEPAVAEPPKPEAIKPLVKPEPPKLVPPKPVAIKPEPPKAEPARTAAAKPEPAKPDPKKPAPTKGEQAAEREPATGKPAQPPPPPAKRAETPSGQPSGKAEGKSPDAGSAPDAYAALGDKWRAKAATGGGGGVGGRDAGSGPVGTGGYGPGGGGQVVGLEFLAYQQRVVSIVKDVWVNAAARPGLAAKVRFRIAPAGAVSDVRLEQASGDSAFDGSVVRAVQRANPLPPPPARYATEFGDFMIEFHSEEGGQGAP
jgi:TonB family protein